MKQTISYDDEEIMAIKSECAEAIADFGMQFHIIQVLVLHHDDGAVLRYILQDILQAMDAVQ